MAAVSVLVGDLTPFAPDIDAEKAQAMIDDALALAARVAPCITSADFAYPEAARAIIRGAVLRWNESGTGAMQSQTAGPFGVQVDTRQPRRGMFWPSEIQDLASLCANSASGKAFEVDTAPAGAGGTYGVDYVWTSTTTTTPL